MQDNEKKPALRFKGFTDPWEQRKFEEIAVRSSVMSDKKDFRVLNTRTLFQVLADLIKI